MSKKTWKNFCIVGAGNHVMEKIIPALEKENKSILGVVTSKKKNKYKKFETISESLAFLPRDTTYIIGTPPKLHFVQAKEILQVGRDIVIEKPIFISNKEVKKISKLANFDKNIILEGFMYRYTKTYNNFFNSGN